VVTTRKTGNATAADIAGLERHEVVGGVVHQKASPTAEHGRAQLTLSHFLFQFDRRGGGRPGGWWLMTEVEIELETHEVYLPDVTGWRRDRVPTCPTGRPVRIRPDWVCEILSPSTAARDLGHKLRSFHKAGVGHYWVIDPEHETLTVHRWHTDGYLVALAAGRGETVRAEPFEAVEIPVGFLFGEEPAE
jgi:Uma2 family endonuclease